MSSIAKKLMIKPGMKMGLVNLPSGYRELLGDLPEGAAVVENPVPGELDALLAFAGSIAELEHLAPTTLPLVKHDALLWLAYPKKTGKIKTDITRDIGWDAVKQAGLVGVSLFAIDETWSALRFRPSEKVGK